MTQDIQGLPSHLKSQGQLVLVLGLGCVYVQLMACNVSSNSYTRSLGAANWSHKRVRDYYYFKTRGQQRATHCACVQQHDVIQELLLIVTDKHA